MTLILNLIIKGLRLLNFKSFVVISSSVVHRTLEFRTRTPNSVIHCFDSLYRYIHCAAKSDSAHLSISPDLTSPLRKFDFGLNGFSIHDVETNEQRRLEHRLTCKINRLPEARKSKLTRIWSHNWQARHSNPHAKGRLTMYIQGNMTENLMELGQSGNIWPSEWKSLCGKGLDEEHARKA